MVLSEPVVVDAVVHGLGRGVEAVVEEIGGGDLGVKRKRRDSRVRAGLREGPTVLAEAVGLRDGFEIEVVQGLRLAVESVDVGE